MFWVNGIGVNYWVTFKPQKKLISQVLIDSYRFLSKVNSDLKYRRMIYTCICRVFFNLECTRFCFNSRQEVCWIGWRNESTKTFVNVINLVIKVEEIVSEVLLTLNLFYSRLTIECIFVFGSVTSRLCHRGAFLCDELEECRTTRG